MKIFASVRPLVAVIHLPALPGAPRYARNMAAIVEGAVRDAEAAASAGFDALIVENFGDVPFFRGAVPPETVASMAVVAAAVKRATALPLGINVLRNDGAAALSVAVAADAQFIRVNVIAGARVADQGVVQSDAAHLLRLRAALGASDVGLIADVNVKHSAPLARMELEDEACDARERALADVLIVSGARTGAKANPDDAVRVKRATGAPVWVGSGVTRDTLSTWLAAADGVIVGTALRANGRPGGPIDATCAREFAAGRR